MNELVQDEPAGSTDPELMGQLAAIGIVKGKPFEPDERMRRILEEAAAVGNATSRALIFDPRASEGFAYYDGSAWFNMLWVGGYTFETPPPLVTPEGIKPFPADRRPEATTPGRRSSTGYTGITPAMCMRLTGIGSQYLIAFKDADGNHLDGGEDLPGDAAAGHPGRRGSGRSPLYDNQTRSMLQTPQRYPAGRQPVLPDAGGDRERTTARRPFTFGPEQPDGRAGGQLDPDHAEGKGWFAILRLYSPLAAVLRQELAGRARSSSSTSNSSRLGDAHEPFAD